MSHLVSSNSVFKNFNSESFTLSDTLVSDGSCTWCRLIQSHSTETAETDLQLMWSIPEGFYFIHLFLAVSKLGEKYQN